MAGKAEWSHGHSCDRDRLGTAFPYFVTVTL